MPQDKLIYDIDGKVKEISGSYFDDSDNLLNLNNVIFSSASVNLQNGLLVVNNKSVSSSYNNTTSYVLSDGANWTVSTPPAGEPLASQTVSGDVSGTYANMIARNISSAATGTLSVVNGGTGNSSYENGKDIIFVGNNNNPLQLLAADSTTTDNKKLITFDGTNWTLTNQQNNITSSYEVSLFTSSGNWTKPAGTKWIRVLAQGGGGGGGSGANKTNQSNTAYGGTGGSAGGFIDTIYHFTDNNDATGAFVTVGEGGSGALSFGFANDYNNGWYGTHNFTGQNGIKGKNSTFSVVSGSSDQPLLLLHFNDDSVASITDSSVYKNLIRYGDTATLSIGIPTVNTKWGYGKCLRASSTSNQGKGARGWEDGVSAYTGLMSYLPYDIENNNFTMEGWFYLTSYGNWPDASAKSCLFYLGTNGNQFGYGTFLNSSGQFNVIKGNGASGAVAGLTFNLNTWNHVAFVRSGSVGKIYLNGVASSDINLVDIATKQTARSNYCWIGSYPYEGDYLTVNGWVDEFRVMPRALTAAEISTTVTNARPFNDPNIVFSAIAYGGNGGNAGNTGFAGAPGVSSGFISLSEPLTNDIFANGTAGGTSANSATPPTVSYTVSNNPTNYYGSGGGAGGGPINPEGSGIFVGGDAATNLDNGGNLASTDASAAVSSSVSALIEGNPPVFISSGGGGGAAANRNVTDPAQNFGNIDLFTDFEPKYGESQVWTLGASSANLTFNSGCSLASSPVVNGSRSAYFAGTLGTSGISFDRWTYFGTGNFTLEAWIYPTAYGTATDTRYIFDYRSTGSTQRGIAFGLADTNGAYGRLRAGFNSAGTYGALTGNTFNISLNAWNHVALVRLNGVVTIYSNGVNVGSADWSNYSDAVGSGKGWIGYSGFSAAGARVFKGYIDRVRAHGAAQYSGNFTPSTSLYASYPNGGLGGKGSSGAWGSGGGGGGASARFDSPAQKQGGDGGNGYVAIISYK